MLIVSKYLLPEGYKAFAVFPFVFLKNETAKQDKVLLNHERIHLRQQSELLVLPFLIWYFIAFLVHYCRLRNWNAAYREISFEKEAYEKENDFEYLKSRPFFNFIRRRK
ncbi:hypothetical protein [Flavobacterium silvisoli]|uniref:hypothetical protein n=1 Tax=Flavobacterium silvisoli TaxID=2529433 RepID=UPI0013868474|nr:hypothetical protein [Flavobacterium silvisoli]